MTDKKPAILTVFMDGTIQTPPGMTWGQLRKIAQDLMALADNQPIPSQSPEVAQEATHEG